VSGETESAVSGWTVDTLREAVYQRFSDMDQLLAERFATQTKATDKAFDAQQQAMQTAFTAADKAVQAALQAAREATLKAEVAADKRFDAVNEFRAQQQDLIGQFLMRAEYQVAHNALEDKVEDHNNRLLSQVTALELRLTTRLDRGEGSDLGENRAQGSSDARLNQRLVLAGVVISILVIVSQVVIAVVSHHA
jgi:chaperonin cofactor prefoldin